MEGNKISYNNSGVILDRDKIENIDEVRSESDSSENNVNVNGDENRKKLLKQDSMLPEYIELGQSGTFSGDFNEQEERYKNHQHKRSSGLASYGRGSTFTSNADSNHHSRDHNRGILYYIMF